ncbi:MAG: EutN/CcmL family microcompartment protein [Opitutales bacterium]
MKPGRVIGTVTLSHAAPQFRGARWLMVSPMGKEELTGKNPGLSQQSTPVVYDKMGAGLGDEILYVEGAEATQPFKEPIPLDAISVALLDRYSYAPPVGDQLEKEHAIQ